MEKLRNGECDSARCLFWVPDGFRRTSRDFVDRGRGSGLTICHSKKIRGLNPRSAVTFVVEGNSPSLDSLPKLLCGSMPLQVTVAGPSFVNEVGPSNYRASPPKCTHMWYLERIWKRQHYIHIFFGSEASSSSLVFYRTILGTWGLWYNKPRNMWQPMTFWTHFSN